MRFPAHDTRPPQGLTLAAGFFTYTQTKQEEI